jgi:hypothetical protein
MFVSPTWIEQQRYWARELVEGGLGLFRPCSCLTKGDHGQSNKIAGAQSCFFVRVIMASALQAFPTRPDFSGQAGMQYPALSTSEFSG